MWDYDEYYDNLDRHQTDDTYCPDCREHSMIRVEDSHGFRWNAEVYWTCSNECQPLEEFEDGSPVRDQDVLEVCDA